MCRTLTVIFLLLNVYQTRAANVGDACTTPNLERGICQQVTECDILYTNWDTISQNVTLMAFWKESRCNTNIMPVVCCGTEQFYTNSFKSTRGVSASPHLPDRTVCGIQLTNKIFNGQLTALDEFPWLVLLRGQNSQGVMKFFCQGALISERYVLTAAHCLNSTVFKQPILRLGEFDIRTTIDCTASTICNDEPVDIGIEKAIIHNRFDPLSKINDIALIRLNRTVQFTDFIRPICLPQLEDEAEINDMLTVAGWGRTEITSSSPVKLKVRIPKVRISECRETYLNSAPIGDNNVCAGGIQGSDSCSGDSGSPLMYQTKTDFTKWFIEGIVSLGHTQCGTKNWPGVYTRVYKYIDWIAANLLP